jgi:hypothetical protein
MLYQDLRYSVGDSGVVITIPAGFVSDYASVPRVLWIWLPPHGQYSKAAVIHDHLYWTQECTKQQADNLLMIAMKESDVNGMDKWVIYNGVDWGGQSSWDDNARSRATGMIKVIPSQYRDFPDRVSWPEYQKELQKKGVQETWPTQPKDYCKLGDSNEVPIKKVASIR